MAGIHEEADDLEKVVWSSSDIAKRVEELGSSISLDFSGHRPLHVIAVATGAFMFASDLVRKITIPISIEFIRIQSYGNSTESSGNAVITNDIKMDITGKHVLVVEDIIDTGITLSRLVRYLRERGAITVSICAFLDKASRRKVQLELPSGSKFYSGFECPNEFIVGYGMDFAERYRSLPYIGILKDSKCK